MKKNVQKIRFFATICCIRLSIIVHFSENSGFGLILLKIHVRPETLKVFENTLFQLIACLISFLFGDHGDNAKILTTILCKSKKFKWKKVHI